MTLYEDREGKKKPPRETTCEVTDIQHTPGGMSIFSRPRQKKEEKGGFQIETIVFYWSFS